MHSKNFFFFSFIFFFIVSQLIARTSTKRLKSTVPKYFVSDSRYFFFFLNFIFLLSLNFGHTQFFFFFIRRAISNQFKWTPKWYWKISYKKHNVLKDFTQSHPFSMGRIRRSRIKWMCAESHINLSRTCPKELKFANR